MGQAQNLTSKIRMGGWSEQECLLRQSKHGSNVYSKVQGNLPGSSSDRGMYLKCTKGLGVQKYLRKSYCHRIECCLGLPNSQRARESVRWDKHSSSDLDDQQMQDQDFSKETIRTRFDLNPKQEWIQANVAQIINLQSAGENASLNLGPRSWIIALKGKSYTRNLYKQYPRTCPNATILEYFQSPFPFSFFRIIYYGFFTFFSIHVWIRR